MFDWWTNWYLQHTRSHLLVLCTVSTFSLISFWAIQGFCLNGFLIDCPFILCAVSHIWVRFNKVASLEDGIYLDCKWICLFLPWVDCSYHEWIVSEYVCSYHEWIVWPLTILFISSSNSRIWHWPVSWLGICWASANIRNRPKSNQGWLLEPSLNRGPPWLSWYADGGWLRGVHASSVHLKSSSRNIWPLAFLEHQTFCQPQSSLFLITTIHCRATSGFHH